MSWNLTSAIGLCFIIISEGPANTSSSTDACPGITYNLSPNKNTVSFLVIDNGTMRGNCFCEITTSSEVSVCLTYTCPQCRPYMYAYCVLDRCLCTGANLAISPSCIASDNLVCSLDLVSNILIFCQKSTTFTLTMPMEPSNVCIDTQRSENLTFRIQQDTLGTYIPPTQRSVFKDVKCNVESVTPYSSSATVSLPTAIYESTTITSTTAVGATNESNLELTPPIYKSSTSTAEATYQPRIDTQTSNTGKAIGIGIGVGGGVLLIIVIIIIVIFILRKRRAGSNKYHATNSSQGTATAPDETANASYSNPDSAAYDNATTDRPTTLSYQTVAFEDEPVGGANSEYAEVQEPEAINNPNSYDNSSIEIGRYQAYDTSNGIGKNYDNVSENPPTIIENETTVIDNEFYG